MPLEVDSGFRLSEGTDPFEFCAAVRALLDPIRDRLDATWLAEQACELVDEVRFGRRRPVVDDPKRRWRKGLDPYARPLTTAVLAWADEQANQHPMSVWHDPHFFELALGRDPQTGHIVGQHYCTRAELREAFLAMPQVQDFTYRTYVEQLPEGVTPSKWADRRRVWETLYPDYGPAIESGLSLSFKLRISDTDVDMAKLGSGPDINPLILDNLPSDRHRAWHLLAPAMISVLCPPPAESSQIVAAYHEARRIADGKLQPVIDLLEPVNAVDLNGTRHADPVRAEELRATLQAYAGYLVANRTCAA